MTYDEFDQSEDRGWRLIASHGDFGGAARAIETFLETQPDLEAGQRRMLHFHAAQMFGFAGATEQALSHLPFSLEPAGHSHPLIRWNDYVAATEAFLRGNRDDLLAARHRLMEGRTEDAPDLNLGVVDRLIAGFGKPYSDAY